MKWNEAPRLDARPADWPANETEEERKQRAQASLRILTSERGTYDDPTGALEREIGRTAKMAGEEAPPATKPSNWWEQAPVAQPEEAPEVAPSGEAWMNAPLAEAPKQAGWWDTISAIPGTALGQLRKGLGGALRSIAENTTVQTPIGVVDMGPEVAKARAGVTGRTPEEEEQSFREALANSPIAEAGKEEFAAGEAQIQESHPGEMTFWKNAVLAGGSSALSMAPLIAGSVVARSPVPALAGAAAISGGAEYGEQRAAGGSPETAAISATVVGAGEALTELLPTKYLLEAVPGNVLTTLVKTLAADIPGELVQSSIQAANEKLTRTPDMTWEDYGQTLLDTVGATVVAGGLLTGVSRGVHGLRKTEEPEETPEPMVGPQTPEGWVRPSEVVGTQAIDGGMNEPLSAPFEVPSQPPVGPTEQELTDQLISELDAELVTEEELTKSKELLEQDAKQKELEKSALPQAPQQWQQLQSAPSSSLDIGELYTTERQAGNAGNYLNENQGSRFERTFSMGPADAIGKTPLQVDRRPGTYVLGQPTIDRPEAMLRAHMETFEQWRQQYIPNATVVISNEQLFSDSARGWHYSTEPGFHLIVPGVLRNFSDPTKFNSNTQAGVFYTATHEFGHAIITERLFEGMDSTLGAQARLESRSGVVSEETLAQMPENYQALVREFNEVKARVLDNSITAEEFVRTWFGPAKIAQKNLLKDLKVAPTAPAMNVVKAVVNRAVAKSRIKNEVGAKELRAQLTQDFLSLDEYGAEQIARHAYAQKWEQKTALGKFFESPLKSLREVLARYFKGMKAEGHIRAGVNFSEWLEGLSRANLARPETEIKAEAAKNAGKPPKAIAAPKAKPKAKGKAKVKVKRAEHNVKSSTTIKEQKKAFKLLKTLEDAKKVTPEKANELRDLINREEWNAFIDEFQAAATKNVNFSLDMGEENHVNKAGAATPAQKTAAVAEWQKEAFGSSYFKSWFGDWQDADSKQVSKVRTGGGEPLVVFGRLDQTDWNRAGPPFGTLRNVTALGRTDVRPTVLNIRNPHIVRNPQELQLLDSELARQALLRQGFDGIQYTDHEGDQAWIPFSPAQIRAVPQHSKVYMDLDFDLSTESGQGASKLLRGVRNFLSDAGPLRRALRSTRNLQYHVLQLQQLAHLNPEQTDLVYMNEQAQLYSAEASKLLAPSDKVVAQWEYMSERNEQRIAKFVYAERDSGEMWFGLKKGKVQRGNRNITWWEYELNDTTKKKLLEHGIDIETPDGGDIAKLILDAKNALMTQVNELEQALIEAVAIEHIGRSPAVTGAALKVLIRNVHEIRLKPFFPSGRFGNWMMIVRRDGEVVHREAFESEEALNVAFKKMKAAQPGDQIEREKLTDREYVMLGIPANFVELAARELGLNDDAATRLRSLIQPTKTDRPFKKYEEAASGLKGYSTDAMRSFANFTWHNANMIAKLKFRPKFNLAVSGMREKVAAAASSSDQAQWEKLQNLMEYMERTRDYAMNPESEAHTVRAFVAIGYLMLNVKTAVINFAGMMTTWSDITSRYGPLKGSAMFAKSMAQMALSMKLTNLNDRRKGNYLKPETQKALDRALEEGHLSQSYAYHVAGMANAGNWRRTQSGRLVGRYTRYGIDAAMSPFRLTELATRRASFLLNFEAAMLEPGATPETSYTKAVSQSNLLQGDYTHMNRSPFMRGGALKLGPVMPVATIFMSFMQMMMFHTYGLYEVGQHRKIRHQIEQGELPEGTKTPTWWNPVGKGAYTVKLWLVLMALAGYEGLPGVESLLNLVEGAWRLFGFKKSLRQEIREFVQSVGGNPEFMARGLGHNVFGFDLSRSIGLGTLVPGTQSFALAPKGDAEGAFGEFALDAIGPAGGFIRWGLEMAVKDKPYMEHFGRIPGGVGNIFTGAYWADGGLTTPSGVPLLRDEAGNPREPTAYEIWGRALGFNPTEVSRERQINFEFYDRKTLIMTQQRGLLKDLNRARDQKDEEAAARIRRKISEFNEDIPADPEWRMLRITPAQIARSRQAHIRQKIADRMDRPIQRKFRGLRDSIRESYEAPEPDEGRNP